jgi:hypothetical protein
MVRTGMLTSFLALSIAAVAYSQPPESPVGGLAFVYGQAGSAHAADQIASTDFYMTVIRLQREFELSPDYQSAQQDVSDAYDALRAAERPILRVLAGDSHYQELAQKHLKIEMVLADDHLLPRDLWYLAGNKMDYGSEMHRMEADALAADPAVQAARKQLVAAQKKVDLMRQSFEASLYKNPQWAAAKQSYDNAEIADAGAESALIGANLTACLDVDSDVRHTLYSAYNSPFGEPYVSLAYYGRRY